MRRTKEQKCTADLLPFHIIEAASAGDIEAIQVVLKHYEVILELCLSEKCLMNRDMYITAWTKHCASVWK